MEMGFCRLNEPYSPELVRSAAVGSPQAVLGLISRGFQIVLELGTYALALYGDGVKGGEEEEATVKIR
jgi:hypothetical protein